MQWDGAGEGMAKGARRRRLSVTTEAKRRTSLEDDDEEEFGRAFGGVLGGEEDGVVHVKMAEADVEEGKAGKGEGKSEGGPVGESDDGDGELVEIQHAEMLAAE